MVDGRVDMPVKSQMIHARIEPKLKRSAEEILSRVGLSTAGAIRLFFRQVELHKGLPFLVQAPNQKTVSAMREANSGKGLKRYRSFLDLRGNL